LTKKGKGVRDAFGPAQLIEKGFKLSLDPGFNGVYGPVQANAGRNGQIQAAHRAGHRQSDTPIKIFCAYAFWQSSRFGSEYKPISRLEMHLGVQLRGEFSEEPSPIWGHACP
jgi:hypothetical protein